MTITTTMAAAAAMIGVAIILVHMLGKISKGAHVSTPYHAMPCHAMPCHAMPYHTIPYRTSPSNFAGRPSTHDSHVTCTLYCK